MQHSRFWKNAYAHQRGKLLKKVNVPEDQIIALVNKKYMELPAALQYEIETSGINKKEGDYQLFTTKT